jgi:hypothetical protein
MQVTLPGQKPEMGGLADLLLPRFEMLWKEYAHEFAA